MSRNKRMFRSSQIHRKLENDECFDYGCTHESRWKVIYRDPDDGARVETRLCEAHSDEFLPTLKRPWVIVGLRP